MLKKDTPHWRAKEKPNKMVGGRTKSHVVSNLTEMLRGLKQNLGCTRTQRAHWAWARLALSIVSPGEAQVSSGLQRGQGLWLQQTWKAWCVTWVLLEEVATSSIIEPLSRQPTNWRTIIWRSSHTLGKILVFTTDFPTWNSAKSSGNLTFKVSGIWLQNFNRTGKTDSCRAQTKPCRYQDIEERSRDPSRDWATLACECPGFSGRAVSWQWPVVRSWALNTTVLGAPDCWHKSFWGRSTQGKLQRRDIAPPIKRKLNWRFTEHGLAHGSKSETPPQPFPLIRKLPQAASPYPSEGRQNENHNYRKFGTISYEKFKKNRIWANSA